MFVAERWFVAGRPCIFLLIQLTSCRSEMEARKCYFVSLVAGFLLLALLVGSTAAQPQLLPASFVFGDSLADSGNNNYIQTLSRANNPPNGIDFPGKVATGRFCDGRTSFDIVGQMAGLQGFTPPYMAPSTNGKVILRGVNFASGASGILDSSGYNLGGRIPFNKQLANFATTRAQLVAQIGEPATADLLSKSLFSVNFGSNDYLDNYYQPLSPVGNLTSNQLAVMLITDYRKQLTSLYNMGARKVVVVGMGPTGCIPYQLTVRFRINGECDEMVNGHAQTFNRGVVGLVMEFNEKLPGAKFVYLDAYKAVSEIIANPRAFGFTVADTGCCGFGSTYKGAIPCFPNMQYCSNRFDYVFWDPYHPTDKANVILASRFFNETGYSYPKNIRLLLLS